MKPEEKLGALASYLEIEYQQKNNQCNLIVEDAKKHYSNFEMVKYKPTDAIDEKHLIEKFILKPITAVEDALLYAEEWNDKSKAKLKKFVNDCQNQEYATSVEDVLSRHIVEFEATTENGLELIQIYKFKIYDYLGIPYKKDETV